MGKPKQPARVSALLPSNRLALQLAPLALGEPSPDPKAFVVCKCIFKAFLTDLTGEAHLLCLTGGTTLFRKECFWIRLSAQSPLLPGQFVDFSLDQIQFCHRVPLFDPPTLLGQVNNHTYVITVVSFLKVKPNLR